MNTLSSILPVIIMLLVGMLCRRKNIISQEGINGLQALVMNITLPVTLFMTFFNAKLTANTILIPAIFLVFFGGGYLFALCLCKVFRQKNQYLPFTMTTAETGMLGYAMLGLIVGQANTTTFALMDLAQVLGIFIITLQILQMKTSGQKATAKSILKRLYTNPILIGMLLGILFTITGLSSLIIGAGGGVFIDTICSFIGAPTSAAILLVIGYRINFKGVRAGRLFKAVLMRFIQNALGCIIILLIFHFLGGIFSEPITTISVIGTCILPPSYLLPIYMEPESEKEFYSSAISLYTLLCIAGYIIMMLVYK